jgi:NAD-dependent deacetylase
MSDRIRIDQDTWVLVLTGAGVSAESGIPTFRGSADGLWENHPIEQVASPEGFAEDPALVWRFYSERRARAKEVEPNPGHHALAELEAQIGDRFMLATQNVDGLHSRAGNKRVIEIHGNLFTTRCSRCDRAPFSDDTVYPKGEVPGCARCAEQGASALLRPHIVWFGEMLDQRDLHRISRFISAAPKLVFMAAGTSGAVYPAAGFVQAAKRFGADTVLVNADKPDNRDYFDRWIKGRSGEVLPGLFDVVSG